MLQCCNFELKSKIAMRNKTITYVTLFSIKSAQAWIGNQNIDPQSNRFETLTSWSITCHPIIEITIIWIGSTSISLLCEQLYIEFTFEFEYRMSVLFSSIQSRRWMELLNVERYCVLFLDWVCHENCRLETVRMHLFGLY